MPLPQEDTLRTDLEAAFEEAEEDLEGEGSTQPESTETPPEDSLRADVETAVEGAAPETSPETPEGTPPATKPAAAEGTPSATPTEVLDANDPLAKAPGTWTPQARERWANVDKEVKAEIWKREREASRALTLSADARRAQQEFERTIQPYLGFIAAENSTPLKAVNNMMQTAAALRVGTAQQKAHIAANLIRTYGIDLMTLDTLLAGKQAPPNPQDLIDQRVQQAIAPLLREREEQRSTQSQRMDQEIDRELAAFVNDPKHEFYADVKDVMADIIELGLKRGEEVSLTDAYQRAILIHEPVRRVVDARRQQESARTATLRAKQARRAAISIPESSETRNVAPDPSDSIRSAIESAISKTEGR